MPRIRNLPASRAGSVAVATPGTPSYELCGPPAAPVIVVLGGISAGRHVTATTHDSNPGWWQGVVRRGGALDPTRHRILGLDWLVNADGPTTTEDQANGLLRVLDHLGIATVHALVGASYGGMVALAFAAAHPTRVGRLVLLSAAHRPHPMATAQRVLQRRIVQLGLLAGVPSAGVALARALGLTTYRSQGEFAERFATAPRWIDDAPRWEVEDYLDHGARGFAQHFDPRRYLALSESLDLHAVEPAAVTTPTTLFGVAEDQLVPLWQLQQLRDGLGGPVELVEASSRVGHDAFLTEHALVDGLLRRVVEAEVGDAPGN